MLNRMAETWEESGSLTKAPSTPTSCPLPWTACPVFSWRLRPSPPPSLSVLCCPGLLMCPFLIVGPSRMTALSPHLIPSEMFIERLLSFRHCAQQQ